MKTLQIQRFNFIFEVQQLLEVLIDCEQSLAEDGRWNNNMCTNCL